MGALTIPRSPQELTPEWMTSALRDGGVARAPVATVSCETIGEGAGFLGQLARVSLTYDGDAAWPATLIGKFPALDETARYIGNLFRFYEREIRFYRELAPRVGVRVPNAYYSALDVENDEYLLLLEDLAPARCCDQLATVTEQEAESVVQALASFQARWWDSPELEAYEWMPNVNAPVHQSAQQSYQDALPTFIERFGDAMSPQVRAIAEEEADHVIDLLNLFEGGPRTIIHGDYRLDNLFFSPDGSVAVIDWQITCRGRGIFDLAYFLSGNVTPEVRRKIEKPMLRLWYDRITANGHAGYSFDDAVRDYRSAVLYCLTYVVIGPGSLDPANERGMALFRAWLERSSAAIVDLDAAELMPGR